MLGLTHALVVPSAGAGLFAGTAAIIRLNERDTVVKANAGLVVALGAKGQEIAGGSKAAALAQLRESFEDARDYRANKASFNAGNRRDYPLSRHDLEAIIPVLDRKIPLIVQVERAADIERVIEFANSNRIRLIISGAEEGWRVADKLAANKIPVIMDPILNLPASYDSLGARLDNAKLLNEAGVTLIFTGMSWHNTHNAYLVRQSAGNAVANGLPYQVALAAVTVNPAKIFGLTDIGDLAVGSPANLVLWSGDPFEPSTIVEKVWMAGIEQPLVSRATRLRDRYFSRLQQPN
jgi:imidazolonepropionase-like amidohydrolase